MYHDGFLVRRTFGMRNTLNSLAFLMAVCLLGSRSVAQHLISLPPTLTAGSSFGLFFYQDGDDDQDHEEDDSDGLIMYAVDNHGHNLIRYSLEKDAYDTVGSIHLSGGTVISEIRSLGYIPGRLHLYGVWNYLGSENSKLVKIDMFSGETTPMGSDIGYGSIEGLVAAHFESESHDENGDDEDDDDGDDEEHLDDVAIGGQININPNNSPQNEFELVFPDGSKITRDDLQKEYSGYDGAATSIHVKPKGNGNQNGLMVNGEIYPLSNGTTYDITADDGMSVNLYNDHIVNGKSMGH